MNFRLFFVWVSIGLIVLSRTIAQDNIDPDTQAQINAAKKQAEKMGVKMPDIDKMMQESAAEDAAASDASAKKAAATKPEPLAALPTWVPALDGFQATTGSGKHWTNDDGKEQGTMIGTLRAIRTPFLRNGSNWPNRDSAVRTLPGHRRSGA